MRDEFENKVSETISNILAESRKITKEENAQTKLQYNMMKEMFNTILEKVNSTASDKEENTNTGKHSNQKKTPVVSPKPKNNSRFGCGQQ
eukprot:11153715-Ditylum_brightwellii.AAC.1